MTLLIHVAVAVLMGVHGWAAPVPNKDFDGVKMALQLPLPNRLKALSMQGPKTFERLQELSQSKSESLETRWRAITSMGRMEPVRARPLLEAAMQSSDWAMRNAAVVVLQYGERSWAVEWARKLLDDDALVVRTAAVEAIDKMSAIELEDTLWKKLYAQENFKNGKSLWIRKHIARTLARFARPGQEKNFRQVLTDADPALHPAAIEALSKLTSRQLTRDEWLVEQL